MSSRVDPSRPTRSFTLTFRINPFGDRRFSFRVFFSFAESFFYNLFSFSFFPVQSSAFWNETRHSICYLLFPRMFLLSLPTDPSPLSPLDNEAWVGRVPSYSLPLDRRGKQERGSDLKGNGQRVSTDTQLSLAGKSPRG